MGAHETARGIIMFEVGHDTEVPQMTRRIQFVANHNGWLTYSKTFQI